jgi:hypothetical protein
MGLLRLSRSFAHSFFIRRAKPLSPSVAESTNWSDRPGPNAHFMQWVLTKMQLPAY